MNGDGTVEVGQGSGDDDAVRDSVEEEVARLGLDERAADGDVDQEEKEKNDDDERKVLVVAVEETAGLEERRQRFGSEVAVNLVEDLCRHERGE